MNNFSRNILLIAAFIILGFLLAALFTLLNMMFINVVLNHYGIKEITYPVSAAFLGSLLVSSFAVRSFNFSSNNK